MSKVVETGWIPVVMGDIRTTRGPEVILISPICNFTTDQDWSTSVSLRLTSAVCNLAKRQPGLWEFRRILRQAAEFWLVLPFFVVKSPLKRGKKEREGGKRKEGRKDAKPLS
jgi:hypothetical protein